jgi:uncharacterized protein (TIGR00255 family)
MTGFARADGRRGGERWAWELRSVNHKGLDIRCRLPPGLDALEPAARDRIGKRLARGAVSAALQLDRGAGGGRLAVNRAAFEELLALHAAEAAAGRVDPAPPRLEAVLAVRGVAEVVESPPDEAEAAERHGAMLATLDEALSRLVAARAAEGKRLAAVLADLVAEIARLATAARGLAAVQPERLRQRLDEQLAALLAGRPPLPEERLAQEAALLATKADVREELDRLAAHAAAVAEALAAGGAVGRKLDFLSQELNREANTLCSKSTDLELTRIGLDLKTAVDRFREQAANLE